MIELVYPEILEKTEQFKNLEIFSAVPEDLCEKYNYSDKIFTHLHKAHRYSDYIIKLLKFQQMINYEMEQRKLTEIEDIKEGNKKGDFYFPDSIIADVEGFGYVNAKEKIAITHIVYGRKIFKEFEAIARTDISDEKIKEKYESLKQQIGELPPLEKFNGREAYRTAISEENDIYEWFPSDIKDLVVEILKSYFTRKNFFDGGEKCLFAIDEDLIQRFSIYAKEEVINNFISEFEKLEEDINKCSNYIGSRNLIASKLVNSNIIRERKKTPAQERSSKVKESSIEDCIKLFYEWHDVTIDFLEKLKTIPISFDDKNIYVLNNNNDVANSWNNIFFTYCAEHSRTDTICSELYKKIFRKDNPSQYIDNSFLASKKIMNAEKLEEKYPKFSKSYAAFENYVKSFSN